MRIRISTNHRFRSNIYRHASLLPLSLLLLAGCQNGAATTVKSLPTVIVAQVSPRDSLRRLNLSGLVKPLRSQSLSFSVPGTVEEVLVEEGQLVDVGQPLGRLANRTYADALGIAQAAADRADDAFRRLEPMHENGTLPEVQFVEVETARRQAQHALAIARRNLDDTVLRSPTRGRISRRHAEAGENVAPGLPALTLLPAGEVLVGAPVPEKQVSRIETGHPAVVEIPALGRHFKGRVREIAVAADPLTRTFEIRIALPDPDGALRIGMVARVSLDLPTDHAGVAVPPEALRLDGDGRPSVFVLGDDGRIALRPVELDGYSGERVALSTGLEAGEDVVVSGTPMLSDGQAVEVRR